jgi:hypothetical protein
MDLAQTCIEISVSLFRLARRYEHLTPSIERPDELRFLAHFSQVYHEWSVLLSPNNNTESTVAATQELMRVCRLSYTLDSLVEQQRQLLGLTPGVLLHLHASNRDAFVAIETCVNHKGESKSRRLAHLVQTLGVHHSTIQNYGATFDSLPTGLPLIHSQLARKRSSSATVCDEEGCSDDAYRQAESVLDEEDMSSNTSSSSSCSSNAADDEDVQSKQQHTVEESVAGGEEQVHALLLEPDSFTHLCQTVATNVCAWPEESLETKDPRTGAQLDYSLRRLPPTLPAQLWAVHEHARKVYELAFGRNMTRCVENVGRKLGYTLCMLEHTCAQLLEIPALGERQLARLAHIHELVKRHSKLFADEPVACEEVLQLLASSDCEENVCESARKLFAQVGAATVSAQASKRAKLSAVNLVPSLADSHDTASVFVVRRTWLALLLFFTGFVARLGAHTGFARLDNAFREFPNAEQHFENSRTFQKMVDGCVACIAKASLTGFASLFASRTTVQVTSERVASMLDSAHSALSLSLLVMRYFRGLVHQALSGEDESFAHAKRCISLGETKYLDKDLGGWLVEIRKFKTECESNPTLEQMRNVCTDMTKLVNDLKEDGKTFSQLDKVLVSPAAFVQQSAPSSPSVSATIETSWTPLGDFCKAQRRVMRLLVQKHKQVNVSKVCKVAYMETGLRFGIKLVEKFQLMSSMLDGTFLTGRPYRALSDDHFLVEPSTLCVNIDEQKLGERDKKLDAMKEKVSVEMIKRSVLARQNMYLQYCNAKARTPPVDSEPLSSMLVSLGSSDSEQFVTNFFLSIVSLALWHMNDQQFGKSYESLGELTRSNALGVPRTTSDETQSWVAFAKEIFQQPQLHHRNEVLEKARETADACWTQLNNALGADVALGVLSQLRAGDAHQALLAIETAVESIAPATENTVVFETPQLAACINTTEMSDSSLMELMGQLQSEIDSRNRPSIPSISLKDIYDSHEYL